MESPDLIESITNENDYVQDPLKPIVFGGVIFENLEADGADLNYTLRLATEHVQRLSNFLFMPYSFSGPQVLIMIMMTRPLVDWVKPKVWYWTYF